ncbi:MAG TPA: hypothetical protein VF980_15055 [Thermoanaerobaculia bacterium]
MSRYIKKFGRVGHALGPSEERGFALWAGYDIAGVDDDLSALGLIKVDEWSGEQLAEYGVTTFTRVDPGDSDMYRKLGIRD